MLACNPARLLGFIHVDAKMDVLLQFVLSHINLRSWTMGKSLKEGRRS